MKSVWAPMAHGVQPRKMRKPSHAGVAIPESLFLRAGASESPRRPGSRRPSMNIEWINLLENRRRRRNGYPNNEEKDDREEKLPTQIFAGCGEASRDRNEVDETRQAQKRRQRQESDEPEAGNCYRTIEGAKGRQEGSPEEGLAHPQLSEQGPVVGAEKRWSSRRLKLPCLRRGAFPLTIPSHDDEYVGLGWVRIGLVSHNCTSVSHES
jgi:hypothetical protein